MRRPGRDLSWGAFLRELKEEWVRDDVGNVAGAVTFFAVLALFPFLLFLVALAGVLLDPKLVQSLVEALGKVAPAAVTEIVGARIRALAASRSVGLLTFSALAAVVTASGGMVALMDALNTAYGVRDSRSFLKRRALAMAMTLLAAAFSLAAGVVAVALPALIHAIGGPVGGALAWLRLPCAGLVMMFVWGALYFVLPDVDQRFRLFTPGAVVGVVLWVVASWAFSQYVVRLGRYEVTYGALGGVAILLFWMWISSQAMLLGAEINAVLARRPKREARAPGHLGEGRGPLPV